MAGPRDIRTAASKQADVRAEGQRRQDVQGLRAVAVAAVVVFHAGLMVPGGFVGVDVFFVISGFVITAMLLREQERGTGVSLRRFYWRRFKRLTPALAVMVVVTSVVSVCVMAPLTTLDATLKTGAAALLLAGNVAIALTTGGYFDEPAEHNPLLHTWSLGVEEQFYLVFPLLLIGCWAAARRLRAQWLPVAVVTLCALVSFSLAVMGGRGSVLPGRLEPLTPLIGFYSPLTRAWEFAAGVLLAFAAASRAGRPALGTKTASLLGVTGAIGLAASFWLISSETVFPGLWTLLPVLATVMLIKAGEAPNPISTLLATRPLVRLGDWSYSVYLWHWPFIVGAAFVWPESVTALALAALVSLLPAVASYYWVEQRAQKAPRSPRLNAALVAGFLVIPLAITGAGVAGVANGFWHPKIKDHQEAATAFHLGVVEGCGHKTWIVWDDCVFNEGASGPPIYLLGDSNADHFSEGIIDAAARIGRPVVLLTENGCPYVVASFDFHVPANTQTCEDFVTQIGARLAGAPTGTVVLSNSYGLWYPGQPEALGRRGETPVSDHEAKLALLPDVVRATAQEIVATGHELVLVQPVPHWTGESAQAWSKCSSLAIVRAECDPSMPLSAAHERQEPMWAAVALAAAATGAELWDLTAVICPSETCRLRGETGVRYRDAGHISVGFSRSLSPVFEELLS